MKRLLGFTLLLLVTVSLLKAAPPWTMIDLEVATTPISLVGGNTKLFHSASFMLPEWQAGTTPPVYSVPIYVAASESTEDVSLAFVATPDFTSGAQIITPSYTYSSVPLGTEVPIVASSNFIVLPAGSSPLDGNDIKGYINIIPPAIPAAQLEGIYSTGPISVDLKIRNQIVASGTLDFTASVGQFMIVGFADTSSLVSGSYFVDEIIDFGIVFPTQTLPPVTKNVYLHSNVALGVDLSFDTTPPLTSTTDASTLPMTYTYNINGSSGTIVAGVPITLTTTVSDGTVSLGTITFTPGAATAVQTQGLYTATINVTVTAR